MRKIDERNELSPRERAFALLVADLGDTRAIGDKGRAVGWADSKHAYRVAARPRVAAEIERLLAERLRTIRARAARVLAALADRAEAGDVGAARIFLEACGFLQGRGVTVTTNVAQGISDAEREERLLSVRLARHHNERMARLGLPGGNSDGAPETPAD